MTCKWLCCALVFKVDIKNITAKFKKPKKTLNYLGYYFFLLYFANLKRSRWACDFELNMHLREHNIC